MNAQTTPSEEEEEEEEEPEADQAGNRVVQDQAAVPTDQDYEAIRTKDFVYVETVGDKAELYHVTSDPYQMHNLADRPEFAELVKRFSDWLHHAKL
jgi:arylsulfatase A-like enzyme